MDNVPHKCKQFFFFFIIHEISCHCFFFFEETKMNYIINSKGFPSTRCTRENRNSVGTIFTKGKLYRKQLDKNNYQPMPNIVNGLSHQPW